MPQLTGKIAALGLAEGLVPEGWLVPVDGGREMILTHNGGTSGFSGSIGRGFTSNTNVKRMLSVGAVVVALALLCGLGVVQGVLDTSSSPAPSIPWLGNSLSNPFVIPSPVSGAQAPAFASAHKPEFKLQTIAPSNHLFLPSSPRRIPAGVYRTAPYSCIVVVPGPHPDDRCIVRPGGGDFSMPIIKPDLRFIPLHPRKK